MLNIILFLFFDINWLTVYILNIYLFIVIILIIKLHLIITYHYIYVLKHKWLITNLFNFVKKNKF